MRLSQCAPPRDEQARLRSAPYQAIATSLMEDEEQCAFVEIVAAFERKNSVLSNHCQRTGAGYYPADRAKRLQDKAGVDGTLFTNIVRTCGSFEGTKKLANTNLWVTS